MTDNSQTAGTMVSNGRCAQPGRFLYNDNVAAQLSGYRPSDRPRDFHRTLQGYEPTPLLDWPEFAEELGVGRVLVKVESIRLGLPSFKILGASWAIATALADQISIPAGSVTFAELASADLQVRLVAATDGNHGRAVAHIARLLGLRARILVPSNVSPQRIGEIEQEGAEVEIVAGSYDEAVARSASDISATDVLVSDTSWPGYEEIPRRVIEGYSTMLLEIDDELERRGLDQPNLVFVQVGVGAFAAAVTRHFRARSSGPRSKIVTLEPTDAACVMASLAAGRRVEVPGPHDSIMDGLNCGLPSLIAWPVLKQGIDCAVALDDDAARAGMRRLAARGVSAGECAGIAPSGAAALLMGPEAAFHRRRLEIDESSQVLLFVTEGATDLSAGTEIMDAVSNLPELGQAAIR